MAKNRDVISSNSWQCYNFIGDIHKKINGIQDDYGDNSYNFEVKLMRLSDNIHNCLTEIHDVLQ